MLFSVICPLRRPTKIFKSFRDNLTHLTVTGRRRWRHSHSLVDDIWQHFCDNSTALRPQFTARQICCWVPVVYHSRPSLGPQRVSTYLSLSLSLCLCLSLRLRLSLSLSLSLSVLTAIFPGGPELAGTRTSPFWILLKLRIMKVVSGVSGGGGGQSGHASPKMPNIVQLDTETTQCWCALQ